MGPSLSDAQHFEVTPDLLWIETEKRGQEKAKSVLYEPSIHRENANTQVRAVPWCLHRGTFVRYSTFNTQISDKLLDRIQYLSLSKGRLHDL